ERICFVETIDQFGVFEPLPENPEFRPGESVVVYAELRNFSSVRRRDTHVIHLVSTGEIREYGGAPVIPRFFFTRESESDLSKSLRHDCFNRYSFTIPSTLPPGHYTLRIRVTDVPTGRITSRSLDFRVVAGRRS